VSQEKKNSDSEHFQNIKPDMLDRLANEADLRTLAQRSFDLEKSKGLVVMQGKTNK